MNNKIIVILGLSLVSVLVIILIILAILNSANKTSTTQPTPTPTPIEHTTQLHTPTPHVTLNPRETPHPEREMSFEEGSKKVYEDYPWLNNMPIQTDRFFVYFDTNKKKFIAKLYVTSDQVDNARTEIVSRLRILKVPLDKYPIEFIPKSQ